MLIMLMGFISVSRMIVDIFPTIDIPVVYVAWSYSGLNAEDMERRVVLVSERAYSTTVNGIDHIESLSIPGQGILKIYFQQGADIGSAIAQISAQSNAVLRIAPPGMQPPNIIPFNASNVPVLQVTLNSKSLPEQMLSDYANQFLRVRLFTPGPILENKEWVQFIGSIVILMLGTINVRMAAMRQRRGKGPPD